MKIARSPRVAAALAALPDAATAAVYLYAWWTPARWHPGLIKNLMLLMLIEFFVVHASAFSMTALAGGKGTRHARALGLLLLFGLYALMVGAFSWIFDAWWPLFAIAWLFLSKIGSVYATEGDATERIQRNMATWGASVLFYIGAVFATCLLPLPRFGVSEHGSAYGITGSGLWVESPQTVIVAGLLYFGALAWLKAKMTVQPAIATRWRRRI